MKTNLFLLFLAPVLLSAQPKFEIQEFTGTVTSIEPAWRFAYERLRLEVDGKPESFLFYPNYGKFIIENVSIGDRIGLRVKTNMTMRQKMQDMKPLEAEMADRFSQERIVEIKLNGKWIELPYDERLYAGKAKGGVLLEKKVLDIYKLKERVRAFIFENGLVGQYSILSGYESPARDIQKGDVVSFMGRLDMPVEGSAFPIPQVKQVYFFSRLTQGTGRIKSYLYKQNSVCLGVVMQTDRDEVSVGFPSDHALRVKNFLSGDRAVDFYYSDFKVENQPNPFELHALISGSDTLKIEELFFYGGEDVHHEYSPVEISGTLTRINRTSKGKIMSVMVGNEVYVEVDMSTAQELGQFIKKGKKVVITGDERIKKEGEIYQKNFRIITPRTIRVDGKEFLLK